MTPDYLAMVRARESGGNLTAKNPRSTATGPYQFLEGTWNELARKYPELGLTPDGRTDPAQNERAIRAFTAENARALESAGIPTDPGNLYAAHFLGAGGARTVLTQPDTVPVDSLLSPQVVAANPFLKGMTVGQFRAWAAGKGGATPNGNTLTYNRQGAPAAAPSMGTPVAKSDTLGLLASLGLNMMPQQQAAQVMPFTPAQYRAPEQQQSTALLQFLKGLA